MMKGSQNQLLKFLILLSVYIASNGYVLTGPHLKLKSFCKLSEEWPWGQQNCTASLGSWVYDETALDIHAGLKSFKWDGINLKWLLDERVRILELYVLIFIPRSN